jgi:hypothetical protein
MSPACQGAVAALAQRKKILEMRAAGDRGLTDHRCSDSIAISGDHWPDDVRLSDLEPRFICGACGHRGADVQPDFNWNRPATAMMGYR